MQSVICFVVTRWMLGVCMFATMIQSIPERDHEGHFTRDLAIETTD